MATTDGSQARGRRAETREAGLGPFAQSLLSAFFPELFEEGDHRGHADADARDRRPSHKVEEQPPATDEASLEFAGLYIISVAARLADMHPQTLRKYERFGLIRPSRTAGSLRLYSEEDLLRLKLIRALVERFDLNLAGVRLAMEMVYRLSNTISKLESDQSVMKTREGRMATRELRDLLSFLVAS